jgi:hypothetical protein
MQPPTADSTSSPSSPGVVSSSPGNSDDDDPTNNVQYYNYFFLLLALAFLILFLLLFCIQRNRRRRNARLQQYGRAALVQDASRFPPTVRTWNWYATQEPPHRLDRIRIRSASNDPTLEAGLDERGEAPPPYGAAANDKAPPMNAREAGPLANAAELAGRQVPGGERMMCRLPPDYRRNDALREGFGVLARPARVATVPERLEEIDLEGQPPQNVYPVHPNRTQPKFKGRWGST